MFYFLHSASTSCIALPPFFFLFSFAQTVRMNGLFRKQTTTGAQTDHSTTQERCTSVTGRAVRRDCLGSLARGLGPMGAANVYASASEGLSMTLVEEERTFV